MVKLATYFEMGGIANKAIDKGLNSGRYLYVKIRNMEPFVTDAPRNHVEAFKTGRTSKELSAYLYDVGFVMYSQSEIYRLFGNNFDYCIEEMY